MTCIAGLVDNGRVYMGGDSAGVGNYDLVLRKDPKVFRNGPFLMGFTSSFRMGQLLRYHFRPPEIKPDDDMDEYLSTAFVDAVRSCLKDGGYARKNNEEEEGGTFLVGYKDQLYVIESDYQVGKPLDGFAAIGSGAQIANGALFATRGLKPEERVRTALEAAERFNAAVRAPFTILEGP